MRTSTAALARLAAICGLLVAPSAVEAQLRCTNPETDIQIRRVSFEGNQTFSDDELELHIVSTPTDLSARVIDRRVIPLFGAIGLGAALMSREDKWEKAALFGAGGLLLGAGISNIQGTERCLAPGTLAGDILNLSSFYRDQGFNDVRVDTTKRIDGRWAHVGFRVTEGRPVLVDTLSFVGFDTAAVGELPTSFNSRTGGRYSPTLTQEDVDSLETRLRDRGYPEGRVNRDVRIFAATYTANVKFEITPGPKAKIGTITVNTSTLQGRSRSVREDVIRSMLRFRSGDTYSERALFESERRFYRVGAFLSAEIAPIVSHVHSDSLVDVVVNVVEDLTHSFSIEPGFGTLDCFRLRSDYSEKAFLGGINRLDLSGSVSKLGLATANGGTIYGACRKLQENPPDGSPNEISSSAINYNATARLTRPLPLPGGLQPSLSAYTERRGGFQSYLRTTKIGGALTLSKNVTRTIFMDATYNLEYGHTEASETVLCFLFRACDASARDQLTQGDKRLSVAGVRFSRDRRNSADSASRGSVVRLELRAAHRWIGSDRTLEFNKGVIDAAQYLRVGPGVVALRARAGIIGGGQETDGARLPPPQERLYAGGETSVRGFRQSELGPLIYVTSDPADSVANALNAPDQASRIAALQRLDMRIIPAGGNAMYVGNLEYRLPGPFLKTLQTVLFVDAGALTTAGITTIAGSNQFRITPGVAVKYFSPVGPIQFNVGYNRYDPLAGPAFSDQFTDGAGNPILRCISGEVAGVCQPLSAIAPRSGGFHRRLTLTVSFPPDF